MNIRGFSLAEVLIALALLGVIAVFAVPKLLQNNQTDMSNMKAKEVAFAISSAYEAYKTTKTPSASTGMNDLYPFLNHTEQNLPAVTVDCSPNWPFCPVSGTFACGTPSLTCTRFLNGAVMVVDTNAQFGGEGATNGITFTVDPDGKASNTKSVTFSLYFNGQLRDSSQCYASTTWKNYFGGYPTFGPVANGRPSWFEW